MIFCEGNLHRDRAQRYARHGLERGEDQGQTGSAHSGEFAEQEHHASFILLEHTDRDGTVDDRKQNKKEYAHHAPRRLFGAKSNILRPCCEHHCRKSPAYPSRKLFL